MKTNFCFTSNDQVSVLHGIKWTPSEKTFHKPKAVLQLIHGMAEFAGRYENFANFCNTHGIVVYSHDHLGHGESLSKDQPVYGYIAKQQGSEILFQDCWSLTKKIQKEYPETPLFLLGHSMGSFILRNYLQEYSEQIDGAILMGTGSYRKEAEFLIPLLKIASATHGAKKNLLLNKLAFDSYSKYFPENQQKSAWISKNQKNVEHYNNHPKLGFPFTNNGFFTLFSLMKSATQKNWMNSIRKELPILLISGKQDPVGQMGKGPKKVGKELSKKNFENVTMILYETLRHEILNEEEAEWVFQDIYLWITKNIKKQQK